MSRYMKLRGAMERASQNYRIQGTNASMTKSSMIMLYDYLKSNNLFDNVKIVLSLHDEIVVEVKDCLAESIDHKLTELMLTSGTYFCKQVPMEVKGGISKIWEH